ncbi:MAG: DUF2911 domain-containing protein [Balneolales bacterium]|nr:DUF2911 domain-containing protein [Balneolales bacterium]
MKKILQFSIVLFLFALVQPLIEDASAQSLPEPRQSPIGLSRAMLGDTYVKVIYGRPSVRERQVFGSLVPFNEVWRTGANEATEITFTGPVNIEGNEVEEGTYALFTIPGTDEWTLILNTQLGQWGSYNYSASKDLLRLRIPVQTVDQSTEMFTIRLDKENNEDNHAVLSILWENVRVDASISLQE